MVNELHHHEVGDVVRVESHSPPERVLARFHGGFGAVYIVESTDPVLPGLSALKTVRRDRMTPKLLDGFHDEAAVWSKLPHSTGILPAYSVRRYNAIPYIRTRYVPPVANCSGPSLEHLISRFVIHAGVLNTFLAAVANTMAALLAEDRYFSHGDLKPANILLDRLPEGLLSEPAPIQSYFPYVPLVSDFGLARAFYTRDPGRLHGGDLRYIAPEVLSRDDYNSVLADVYSFGATAVHMFLNHPMREGDGDKGMSLDDVSHELAERRPEIPSEVRLLFESCLDIEPGNRPQSFSMIAKALTGYSDALGVRLQTLEFNNRKSGSRWLDDSIRSSPLVGYLQSRRGLSEPDAKEISSLLADAANLRASLRVTEAKELTDNVLERLPGFAPALAGEAFGCTVENHPKRAVNLYFAALQGYGNDPELLEADSLGFSGACSSLAQNAAKAWLDMTIEERARTGKFVREFAKIGRLRNPREARSWLSEAMAELIIGTDLDAASELLERGHEINAGNRAIRKWLMATRILIEQTRGGVLHELEREKVIKLIDVLGLTDEEVTEATRILKLVSEAFSLQAAARDNAAE